MKRKIIACLGIVVLSLASCGIKPKPVLFTGTYTGTSTPTVGAAYPDTIIITQAPQNPPANIQRTFHALAHYYTFNLKGSVTGLLLSIPDTTIFFSPSPTQYWAQAHVSDSTLTMNDVFVYTSADTVTSIFIGVRH